jgi:peroxiredoxin
VQLQEHVADFRSAGLGVAAMTYDSADLLNDFRARAGIGYPLLADVDAASVKALGILNENYAPGDSAYGIPHPGIFVLDSDGVIRAKVFIEGYDTRLHADSVLALARQVLELDGG